MTKFWYVMKKCLYIKFYMWKEMIGFPNICCDWRCWRNANGLKLWVKICIASAKSLWCCWTCIFDSWYWAKMNEGYWLSFTRRELLLSKSILITHLPMKLLSDALSCWRTAESPAKNWMRCLQSLTNWLTCRSWLEIMRSISFISFYRSAISCKNMVSWFRWIPPWSELVLQMLLKLNNLWAILWANESYRL